MRARGEEPPPDPLPPMEFAADGEGQRGYISRLYERYRGSLYRYLRRLVPADDAAELVQETYFRLLRNGNTVQMEAMARSLLFETATNLARDHFRRGRARAADRHVSLDAQELVGEKRGLDEQLERQEVLMLLERAIAALPDDMRTIFLMNRYREQTYPEIARTLNLSTRTVARKMAQAIERLGAALEAAT